MGNTVAGGENMGNTAAGGEQSGSPEPAQGRRPPTTPLATPERRESRQKRKSKLEYCVYF